MNHKYEPKTDPKYVAYSEDVSLIIGSGFSSEEQTIIDRKLEEYKKAQAAKEAEAKYCVEVLFSKDYSLHKPSAGMIICFENGALAGHGQGSIYFCPGASCGRAIPPSILGGDMVFCPECKRQWKAQDLDCERLARLTTQGWAQAIVNKVMRLGMSADVRVVYSFDDIRSAAAREQEKSQGGELMGSVRRGRAVRIYLLRDIVKDTTHSGDLVSRIKAFLEA